jgi:hypothetical protein
MGTIFAASGLPRTIKQTPMPGAACAASTRRQLAVVRPRRQQAFGLHPG